MVESKTTEYRSSLTLGHRFLEKPKTKPIGRTGARRVVYIEARMWAAWTTHARCPTLYRPSGHHTNLSSQPSRSCPDILCRSGWGVNPPAGGFVGTWRYIHLLDVKTQEVNAYCKSRPSSGTSAGCPEYPRVPMSYWVVYRIWTAKVWTAKVYFCIRHQSLFLRLVSTS